MAGYIGSRAVSVNTTSATLTDDLTIGDDLTVTDDMTVGGTLGVTGVLTATSLDISGNIDVDGTTNLDIVDVDGAVNFAADVTFADGADIITASAGTSNFRAGVNAGNSIASGGNYNVIVGDEAGTALTTGDGNVCIGATAGDAITTGQDNVVIGYQAGTYQANLTTSNGNVLVGPYTDSTDGTTNYAHGLGYNIDCAPGYTTLGLGTSDIRAAHGNVTWSTVSDERYKKDIVDSTAGLSFIKALKPRTFKYKNLGELPETFRAYEADSTDVFKNSNTNHGFIAQEVKTAIDADSGIKDGFKLWDERPDGSQEVAEAALIPILVKAIQELEARIAVLEG